MSGMSINLKVILFHTSEVQLLKKLVLLAAWTLTLSLFSVVLAQVRVEFDLTAEGFAEPTFITHAGDGTSRLFVVEKAGRVRIVEEGRVVPAPFLDISDRVESGEGLTEIGLFSMVMHPQFSQNRRFFVCYTRSEQQELRVRIAEYSASEDDPNTALTAEKVVLETDLQHPTHAGGQLAFASDGYLYFSIGDGGVKQNSQDLAILHGKVMRIDVDRGDPYSIPANNPFVGVSGIREEIWAYGFREPYRFSFDRHTTRLLLADVGAADREEVDWVLPGANYGWPTTEGIACFPPLVEACDRDGLTPPLADYGHNGLPAFIVGGYTYRGPEDTPLRGLYIFGDGGTRRIWALKENSNGDWTLDELGSADFNFTSFGEDEEGHLYVADFFGGKVFRLVFSRLSLFAHFGDGGSPSTTLSTSVFLVNASKNPVSGELLWHGTDGSAASVTIGGVTDSVFPFELGPEMSRTLETSGTSDPLLSGWVEIVSNGPLSASLVLTIKSASGAPITEAGVSSSARARRFQAPIVYSALRGLSGGFAIANPSISETAEVVVTLKNSDDEELGRTQITLGPLQHRAILVQELADLPAECQANLIVSSSHEIVATVVRTIHGLVSASLPLAR